jgi:hypothetical protein
MKRTFFALILCAATVSGVSAQPVGVGPNSHWVGERSIDHYRVYGDGVTAQFTSVDTSTCDVGIETTVSVHASQGIVYGNDEPIESSVVSIIVGVFDRCLDMPVLSVTGRGLADQLQLNPNLKSANLRTTFGGIDDAGRPVVITADLVWNGAGHKDRTSDHDSNHVGVYVFVSNSTGTIREALAGGTVTVDGLDVTPLPSVSGVIERNSTRRLVIYR